MAPNRRLALQQLYALIPPIQCKGLCWGSCGPIEMSAVERRQVEKQGYEIPTLGEVAEMDHIHYCPALTAERRCAIYDHRPMVCRLWGTTVDMPCPHGCRPDRYLSQAESMALLAAAMHLGGTPAEWGLDAISPAELAAVLRTAKGQHIHDQLTARGRRGDLRRATRTDPRPPDPEG